ncbi:kinesin-domain-containing protein [Phaffia rhodozyma]|uniref:Kinesin-like protein n=1 Tax=Phaffia rhodozyma TaxID=264483 RepID=A0A0F7SFJ1_PHARH|nr:kinesin-domain-containing protein [Phaffia rhodozyma]
MIENPTTTASRLPVLNRPPSSPVRAPAVSSSSGISSSASNHLAPKRKNTSDSAISIAGQPPSKRPAHSTRTSSAPSSRSASSITTTTTNRSAYVTRKPLSSVSTTSNKPGATTRSAAAAATSTSAVGRRAPAASSNSGTPQVGTSRSISSTGSAGSIRSSSSVSRGLTANRVPSGGRSGTVSPDFIETNGRLATVEKQMFNMNELLALEKSKIINLETAQSTLQSQLAQKSTEAATARSLSLLNEELLRDKAARERDLACLEREREENSRLHEELRKSREEVRKITGELKDIEDEKKRELNRMESRVRDLEEDLETERKGRKRENVELEQTKNSLSDITTRSLTVNSQLTFFQTESSTLKNEVTQLQSALTERIEFTTREIEAAAQRVKSAERKMREGETERRKLHNIIQELKGNIRVFCRVRPPIVADGQVASIAYPDRDGKQIVVTSSQDAAIGGTREQIIPFAFDKVFQPHSTQSDVFEEISGLTQSVLDGYNCCIFAYGQTGAGKSFTMEGGSTPESMGMIPRAILQIFEVTEYLKEQGWKYELEGQFLEIYNETLNDLLGNSNFDNNKLEIKHEKVGKTTRTTVTDATTVRLTSPNQVQGLLERARSRRAVAATLMNERSSRSHSVFSLRVTGSNAVTGESCEGVLNLVDLAGSERLASSGAGADKDRLKETININKSLSALADVIGALGSTSSGQASHVPYRNSKLTYLLQTSLSGQSKTLMVLNLSPLAVHLNESLCSLRFATKVNSTQIGSAKKQQGAR